MTTYMGSSYMEFATDPERIKHEAGLNLRGREGLDFDTVVGIGMSGALALGVVAIELGIPNVLILRKDSTSSHSYSSHEGRLGKRWLFVDDFIDSGSTFRGVHKRFEQLAADRELTVKFAGAFLYAHQFSGGEYLSPQRTYTRADMRIEEKA